MPDNITELLNSIINDFHPEKFINFFRQKNSRFRPLKEDTSYLGDENFFNSLKLGEIPFDEVTKLVIYAFQVKNPLLERSGKKKQYEKGKRILKEEQADAGIFIFYDENGSFRFSLIHTEYYGTKRSWNNFKRFTYFVSKDQTNKTFKKQIGEGDFSSLENIKSAFSVEKVTKEFYNEIANWYFWAMDKVWFPEDYKYSEDPEKDKEIRIATNLIRLITRIIFIWFIKQKGIVSDKLFDNNILKGIIKDFGKSTNYYNAILQNLFFATLNQRREQRGFANDGDYLENRTHFGIKTLYRYKDLFKIPEEEVLKLFEEVPFLNGGLFDCLDKDGIYIDGFSRNPKKRAKLDDYMFFQEEITSVDLSKYGVGKNEQVRGLIEILKSYNFTIDESTPVDQEVALDPELLGKIFENLLASYNPETATTARKATGSYYTPREIVDYMVDESLKAYLTMRVKEDSITQLLSYSDDVPELTEEEKLSIVKAISEIKILDPACGSGAFPMGILHKLLLVLQKIDPENKYWYKLQREKVLQELDDVLNNEDSKEREQLLSEINEAFDTKINHPDYARKLFLIENCIYGVDIQPIAIQISKLRFFISLIIDQKVDKTKENFGIRPLPNLETKFVCANTLIGLNKPDGVLISPQITKLEEKIKALRHRYFQAKTRAQKLYLQEKDKELREKLALELQKGGFSTETSKKIAEFDLYDQNASADWFDPEWMFGVTDGFDIVIGNPPYVSTKGVSSSDKEIFEKQYGFADDTYNHFYFKGMDLLKQNGILAYISSKTFWTIQTKKNLRELLLNNKILQLFDTANPFQSAMVDTCVAIIQKQTPDDNYQITFLDGKKDLANPEKYLVAQLTYTNTPNQVFFLPNDYNLKIYEQLGKKVNELLNRWWDLISTSKNIEKNKAKLEEYRKNLKPGDITLLGLITEGGQGLATANNGKYVGVIEGSKWADKIRKERPEKLLLATQFCKQSEIVNKQQANDYLNTLSENQIRKLFDDLKEQYGRDIFGQGWLYRIISHDEIADVETLTEDEKLNGIAGNRTFVPYDKGDKDGNRWFAPTPYYIDWSRENVKILQTDPKARWQGYQFYFREGFCWSDVHTINIKCRIKISGIHDVKSMSLFSLNNSKYPDFYFVCVINSTFISEYVFAFIKNTQTFQINDARLLPIIIPTPKQLKTFEDIFNQAYKIQKQKFESKITEKEAEQRLDEIQKELDKMVEAMYMGG